MKKRIISMLLVVVMVLSMFPTAFAADTEEPVYGPIGENLITNGSFEDLDDSGKPVGVGTDHSIPAVNGFGDTHTVVTGEGNVTDGNYAMYVNDTQGRYARG